MGRLVSLAKGFAALVLLVALVAGIPWALWHFVGWPLPHHIPSPSTIGHALDRHGIPARTLVEALAVVVWVTWAVLVASVAAEIPAALAGRRAPRLRVAGVFQPVTGRLVATVVVACLALAPRATHLPAPGPAAGLAALGRPVAAVVLTGTSTPLRPEAAPTPPPGAPMAATGDTIPTAPGKPVARPATSTYLVQRGDTLWGIAERELGDPFEWSKIYALNEGRSQPGGATLTDPHWIDPGWTLLLPATPTAGSPATAAEPPAPPPAALPGVSTPHPTALTPSVGRPSAAPSTEAPPPIAHHESTIVGSANGARVDHRQPAAQAGAPVRLPSGSLVGGTFAAGVLSAVALGRLRRRHAYRYHPPEPGRDLTPPPLRPTLRHLADAAAGNPDDADMPLGPDQARPEAQPSLVDDAGRRQQSGQVDIAARGESAVTVELTDLCGVAVRSPAADEIARAITAGLLVSAEPGAAEVLLTADVAGRLLPGLGDRLLRVAPDAGHLARAVEAERIARARRLDAAGSADATRFRAEHPENPLPLLLVICDPPPPETAGRWAALATTGARLGIAIVFLGDSDAATGRLVADPGRHVTEVDAVSLGETLAGSELFGMRADEAVELLGVLADAQLAGEAERDYGPEAATHTALEAETAGVRRLRPDVGADTSWVAPVAAVAPVELGEDRCYAPAGTEDDASRPLRVQILGPFEITAFGQPVSTGLRSRARMLLAWYLCRPEGATAEQAVDVLWPDTDPDAVLKQFWRALGDLRAGLRGPAGETPEVLEKSAERYRVNPSEVTCDLWELQAHLGLVARAGDDETARRALRCAVDAYRGDLLDGSEEAWIEPARQDLHRRALDAHLRLAELDEAAGHHDAAAATLARAVEVDRYAEEPYRRLMALHSGHGRPDAVTATWKLLRRRLAEIDLDVEAATANLYRTLHANGPSDAPRPIRLRT